MVTVYTFSIENLPDPAGEPGVMARLPKERTEKILKYRCEPDRKRSLGAGLLLLELLPRYGADIKDIRISADGKPEAEGVFFNLSHSGGYVICAVGDRPVGCDVEQVKKAPGQVAEHFFCESEIAYINMAESGRRDQAFFRIWTMKESYMKMTGEGMRLPLNEFEILLSSPKAIRVRRAGKLQPCRICCFELPGYQISVCYMGSKDLEKSPAEEVTLQAFHWAGNLW